MFSDHVLGVIHVVNHPLLPPPSVFQELYLVPHHFSVLVIIIMFLLQLPPAYQHCFKTSALQRSELTKDVDLRYIRGKGLTGSSLVTVFAPTNRAFRALPQRLQLFLFSPFGEKVLKKLLQYHVAPDVVVHSSRHLFLFIPLLTDEESTNTDYVHHTHAHETPESSVVHSEGKPDNTYIDPGALFEVEEQTWPVLSWIMRLVDFLLTKRLFILHLYTIDFCPLG